MKELFSKVMEWGRGIVRPLPSFFDLCLTGILITPFIKDGTKQNIYFIFYLIFLTCLSIGLKPKRQYTSIPLMLLTLWAFIGVFIHSYIIPHKESIVMQYLNMYLLSEGFIYILFGGLFITLVVRYSKNARFLCFLVPLGMIPLLQQVKTSENVTFFASIGVSIGIYLILRRKWLYASILAVFGGALVAHKWPLIAMKWQARPLVFKQLLKEIYKHPFWGSGFYHGLEHPNFMIWVKEKDWGWIWRHNDWLSIGAYLGIFATVSLLWFYSVSLKKIGIRPALIPFLAIGIMSTFQMNFFRIERASIYLLTWGLCLKQGCEKRRF